MTEELDDNNEYDNSPADEVLDLFRKLQTDQQEPAASTDTAKDAVSENVAPPRTRIFLFDSLSRVMEVASIIAPHYHSGSTLFKDELSGRYLLLLTQQDDTKEAFDRLCNIVSEYGLLQRSISASSTFLAEHYETLIRDSAVQSLGNA